MVIHYFSITHTTLNISHSIRIYIITTVLDKQRLESQSSAAFEIKYSGN